MIGSIATRLPLCLSVPQRSHGRTKRTESHWHKMRGLHRRAPRLARVLSDCSADSRKRKVSGSRCTASGQPRVLTDRDESSWWQTKGTSRHSPIKRLTRTEIASEFDVLDPQLAQPLLRQWITKTPTGAAHMQISVLLDRSRPDSLTTQMVDQIRDAIRCARIGPGTRLPSSRRLSEELAISRNTVMRAYDLLLMEGIVESRPASGIYVAEQLPLNSAAMQPVSDPRDLIMQVRMPMPLRQGRAQGAAHAARNRLLYDFFPGHPGADLFPLKTWRRLLQANLSHGGAVGLTQYGEPAGLPALRTAIANHLVAARGIVADPSRIVIVSGIQEGLTPAGATFPRARLAQRRGGSLLSRRGADVRGRRRRDCKRRSRSGRTDP